MTADAFITLLWGAGVTLVLSLAGIAIGLPLGLAMALARWRQLALVSALVAVYVSVMRPMPMITLCLFVFFLLPSVGLDMPPMWAAVVALALNTAAFNCEIWRAGIAAIPRDQLEAASAFGMTRRQTFLRVVFPQVWRACLGPLVSEMTLLLKVTPAVSAIGIVEITRAASRIGAQTYDPLPPLIVATLLYTLIIVLFVKAQRILERRIAARYGYVQP
ncbi:MAG: polar amino acid transport system permease protein [Polaromonas sp.]|jgi:polar amino acid transport system permease protein